MSRSVTLGRTGLTVNFSAFGCLPIQRISDAEAVALLRKALDNGFDFFDTARYYTDSEHKLGLAFHDRRDRVTLASKSMAKTAPELLSQLDTTLTELRTDHLDLWQFHNPPTVPKPGDGSGMYEAAIDARRAGKIRFIGLTSHRLKNAMEAVDSGLYDTVQFPLNYLSTEAELELPAHCARRNVGLLAMKGLSGGLITSAETAYAFLAQFGNVLPLWGIQTEEQLDEFLALDRREEVPVTAELRARIEADRKELGGNFCRGCGYCMPCPAGIEIWNCARISLLLRRGPVDVHTSPEWQAKVAKIKECRHCGLCASRCPYSLDTPELLRRNYEDYQQFIQNMGEHR